MYLLDTDTIIFVLKGHPTLKKNLLENLHSPLAISIVTLMVLYYGAYKSKKVTSNLAKVRALENSLEVLTLGKESADTSGMIKARLERSGNPLDDFDLIIAACAMTYNRVLITNNVKHFQRIEGLRVSNWIDSVAGVT